MKTIAIVHFQPVELYPPIQNLAITLSAKNTSDRILIYTTKSTPDIGFVFRSEGAHIKRYGKSGALSSWLRYLNYLIFWTGCIISFIRRKPAKILYYETNSFLPVFIYRTFFNRKAEVYAHYHEYTSISEYKSNRLNAFIHRYETRAYNTMKWISHTNQNRMDLFLNEHPGITAPVKIMPNYPPVSWRSSVREVIDFPVKFVYVGALSSKTMFLPEFAEWVHSLQGRVLLDIYSQNIAQDAIDYLDALQSPYIQLKNGVLYSELPKVLTGYDIGVILYKGHVKNYVYNAPNKLFEYMAAGMDVWFPKEMITSLSYVSNDKLPKVISIDFERMADLNVESLINRKGLGMSLNNYYCEYALSEIILSLSGNEK